MNLSSKTTKLLISILILGTLFSISLIFKNNLSSYAYSKENKFVEEVLTEEEIATEEEMDTASTNSSVETFEVNGHIITLRGSARPDENQLSAKDCAKIAIENMEKENPKKLDNCKIDMFYIDFFEFWHVLFEYSIDEKYEVLISGDDLKGEDVTILKNK